MATISARAATFSLRIEPQADRPDVLSLYVDDAVGDASVHVGDVYFKPETNEVRLNLSLTVQSMLEATYKNVPLI